MNAIQELQSTLGAQTAAAPRGGSSAESQDRFLKLLVTQMQNQDPLNPMDNAQVTTQLAQLNTVNGIERLNSTLAELAASSAAQQSLQAAMLVGRQVLVAGEGLAFSGQPVAFGVELPQAADRMSITISDAAGNVVNSVEAGPHSAGSTMLVWDGLDASGAAAPPGSYYVSITAGHGAAAIAAKPLMTATVESVGAAADGGIELKLAGANSVGINDIKRFL